MPIAVPENKTAQILNQLLSKINNTSPLSHLILMGDILDLSVASYYDATIQTQIFMSQMLENISPEHIIYIPGNHDHHLWTQVCEEQWIESALKNRRKKLWPSPFPRTTQPLDPLNSAQAGVQFIKGLFPKHCQDKIKVAYPNYAVRGPDGKYYVFDHGHLFDYAQSWIGQWGPGKIIDVNTLSDLERANAPWLEMVWYGLGQGGPLALDSENLYEEAKRLIEKLMLAKSILTGEFITKKAEKAAKNLLKMGKRVWGWIKRGNSRYVKTPSLVTPNKVRDQEELKLGKNLQNYLNEFLTQKSGYPPNFTFVYGHTHSWCNRRNFHGRHVINTGGWTAESERVSKKAEIQTRVLVIKPNGSSFVSISVDSKVQRFCWVLNQAVTDAVKTLMNKL